MVLLILAISRRCQGKPNLFHYRVLNASGICIADDYTNGNSDNKINISAFHAGIYIIVLYSDDGIRTYKYCLTK